MGCTAAEKPRRAASVSAICEAVRFWNFSAVLLSMKVADRSRPVRVILRPGRSQSASSTWPTIRGEAASPFSDTPTEMRSPCESAQ